MTADAKEDETHPINPPPRHPRTRPIINVRIYYRLLDHHGPAVFGVTTTFTCHRDRYVSAHSLVISTFQQLPRPMIYFHYESCIRPTFGNRMYFLGCYLIIKKIKSSFTDCLIE